MHPIPNVYFKEAGQLAYDWIADNLYLVDKALGQILVVTGPEYSLSTTVVAHELFYPSGLAIDPIERFIDLPQNAPKNPIFYWVRLASDLYFLVLFAI